jgi:hypothetical protein
LFSSDILFCAYARYEALKGFPLKNVLVDDDDDKFIPLASEERRITELATAMKSFDVVTKELQGENGVTLAKVRLWFDLTIKHFPSCQSQLASDARIVSHPSFENAIVKVLNKKEHELSEAEANSISCFLLPREPTDSEGDEEEQGGAAQLSLLDEIRLTKKQRVEPSNRESNYVNLAWIPATSNVVERLFSRLKLVFSTRRKSLSPAHLEMVLMLSFNKALWNMVDVGSVYIPSASDENDGVDADSEEEN